MTENQRTDLRRELGALGIAFLWLLGRPLGGLPTPPAPQGTISFYQPLNLWKVNLCHNTWAHCPVRTKRIPQGHAAASVRRALVLRGLTFEVRRPGGASRKGRLDRWVRRW